MDANVIVKDTEKIVVCRHSNSLCAKKSVLQLGFWKTFQAKFRFIIILTQFFDRRHPLEYTKKESMNSNFVLWVRGVGIIAPASVFAFGVKISHREYQQTEFCMRKWCCNRFEKHKVKSFHYYVTNSVYIWVEGPGQLKCVNQCAQSDICVLWIHWASKYICDNILHLEHFQWDQWGNPQLKAQILQN